MKFPDSICLYINYLIGDYLMCVRRFMLRLIDKLTHLFELRVCVSVAT